MVSINYRLGPLGFLTLDSAGIGGNQGIEDILLGLQWVQDNIATFGGDSVRSIRLSLEHGLTVESRERFCFMDNLPAQLMYSLLQACHRFPS